MPNPQKRRVYYATTFVRRRHTKKFVGAKTASLLESEFHITFCHFPMYSFKMASHPTSSSSSSSSSSVTSPTTVTTKPVYRAVDIYLLVWLTRCMTIVFITVNVLFMVYLLNIKHDTDNSNDNTFSMHSHLDGTGGTSSSRMMMSETSFATPFLTSSSASHPNRILTTTQTVTTTPDEDDSMKQSPHSQQQQHHAIQISSPVIFLTDVVDVLPDERQEISRSESHAPPPPQYVRTSSQTTTSRRT